MAVLVLDPYESLLDGSHPKFLSHLKPSSTPRKGKTSPTTTHAPNDQDFLGLQQFARGEIALFASCGTKHPEIARDAYQKAIQYGISDTKQLAEAHHRLGLSYSQLSKFPEAKD